MVAMARKKKLFEKGEIVSYLVRVHAEVVDHRWVGFPDGTGIWKYKLSTGEEKVGSALKKDPIE